MTRIRHDFAISLTESSDLLLTRQSDAIDLHGGTREFEWVLSIPPCPEFIDRLREAADVLERMLEEPVAAEAACGDFSED
jgi:hypothetical protein